MIDIPFNKGGKNSTEVINGECFISIRLGVHKDYARIVLDLAESALLKDFDHKNETLKLNFENKVDFTLEPAQASNTPIITPTMPPTTLTPSSTATSIPLPTNTIAHASPTPAITLDSSPTAIPTVTQTATETPTLASTQQTINPSVIQTETSSQSVDGITLNSITFNSPKLNEVQFSFSQSPQFSILRKGANLYWVIISNAKHGNEIVTKPFFAAQDFVGIVSVLAKASDQDLILEITTDPKAQLFSYREGSSLVIKKE